MPNTPTRMARAALGTTSATLFTVPAATTSIVTEIVAVNTDVADRDVTVALAGTVFMPAVGVPAGSMVTIGLKQVLSATETVTGFATGTGVNIFISGVNVSG